MSKTKNIQTADNQKTISKAKRLDKIGEQISRYQGLDKLDRNYCLKPGQRAHYEKFITGKNKWCFVAEINGKAVGYILLKSEKREPWFKIKMVGVIDTIFIEKKWRGKGIFNLMLKKAYELFKQQGIKYLECVVHADNVLVHRLMRMNGFKDYRVNMWKRI